MNTAWASLLRFEAKPVEHESEEFHETMAVLILNGQVTPDSASRKKVAMEWLKHKGAWPVTNDYLRMLLLDNACFSLIERASPESLKMVIVPTEKDRATGKNLQSNIVFTTSKAGMKV